MVVEHEEDCSAFSFIENRKMKKHILTLAGRLILENGGETYRAEESLERLCEAFGAPHSNVIALPVGFFISISEDNEHADTVIVRIKNRVVDLNDLDRVNHIVRALCAGTISLPDAEAELITIDAAPDGQRKILMSFAAGFSAASFTLLLGGSWFDCIISTFCGFICQLTISCIKRTHSVNFFNSALGGIITAFLACSVVNLAQMGNIDKIIIGGIMPLLPGLALVNSIRDVVRGDLLSAGARLIELLLIATTLAAGVGVVLMTFRHFGGGIL